MLAVPGDAIYAGFADVYVAQEHWPELVATLSETGDITAISAHSEAPPHGAMRDRLTEVNAHFGGETLGDIVNSLRADESDFAVNTLKTMSRNAPLSMACTVEMIHRLRGPTADIRRALALEYRFTARAMEHGDFIEGIRAAIIDKDRNPTWKHDLATLPAIAVSQMLLPLGKDALTFEEDVSS